MAEVLLFHHAQGLTAGVLAFADELRAAGHVVHTPDLYEGRTFAELDDGVAHAQQIGFPTVIERGRRAAEDLPNELVYAGFSLGALPAHVLAQTRPGARGALFLHSEIDLSEFGGTWPPGLPMQIHTMGGDEWVEIDIALDLAATIDDAELFLYPGDDHLFTDRSLPAYDEKSATLLTERVLAFLDAVDQRPVSEG
jgi:dienelactone hydrolase